MAGYRPGAEMEISLLPAPSGALKALSVKATADTGIGINSAIASLGRFIYTAEAKALDDYDAVSNLPPGTPFRGPGGPVLSSRWSRRSTRRPSVSDRPDRVAAALGRRRQRHASIAGPRGCPSGAIGRQPAPSKAPGVRSAAAAAKRLYLCSPTRRWSSPAQRSPRCQHGGQDMGTAAASSSPPRSPTLRARARGSRGRLGDSACRRGPISGAAAPPPPSSRRRWLLQTV